MRRGVVFVTTNTSWGGSEELWSRTAAKLAERGLQVGASIGFPSEHRGMEVLSKSDVDIQVRPQQHAIWARTYHKLLRSGKSLSDIEVERFLDAKAPALVVISDGLGLLRSIGLLEMCSVKKLPFVIISHINAELFWPNDEMASIYRKILPSARRCYFVSEANRRLFETQIGCELSNAEIVCNPFNVDFHAAPPWPPLNDTDVLTLASVARLEPLMKGQDILLEALAGTAWSSRSWVLNLYGEGPMRNCIERMVQRLGLQHRVRIAGYVASVEKIWAENHVLVMPSRYEGMPLAMVEAMLCGRPVLATNVAGHSEIVEDGVTGFLADAPTVSSLGAKLEGLWARRSELERIGVAAASSIRKHVPRDPVRVFADKIQQLC
jgi:glycosyltransferase involved in cell wall biosynthesis